MQKVSVPTVVAIATASVGFGAAYEFAMIQNGATYANAVGWIGMALAFAGLAGVLFFGIRAERKRDEEAAASR